MDRETLTLLSVGVAGWIVVGTLFYFFPLPKDPRYSMWPKPPEKTFVQREAEAAQAAEYRTKVAKQVAAEKALKARIRAAIQKLAAEGISRDDLKDYFRNEIEDELRDEMDRP